MPGHRGPSLEQNDLRDAALIVMSAQDVRKLLRRGSIGPIYCGEREVLRCIFVSVRDRNWREIAPTRWETATDDSGWTATLKARHSGDQIDFEWQGRLEIGDDLRVFRFDFEGRAHRDMEVCRLGMVVLHPVDSIVGAHLTATGPEGTQRLTVTRDIQPQPIVNGLPCAMTQPFSELMIERVDFGSLSLRLTGDLFELEDQRNWGDASFKTYCTPLRLGFPRSVTAGSTVRQAVEVSFRPGRTARVTSAAKLRNSWNAVGPALKSRPAIGRVAPAHVPSGRGMDSFLGWDYIQVPLKPDEPEGLEDWLGALSEHTQLELTLLLARDTDLTTSVVDLLRKYRLRIGRLLLKDAHLALPTAEAVAKIRATLLAGDVDGIPLLAVPRGQFVELNRDVPLDLPVDGIAFPVSSTVHSDDPTTIADNLGAVTDMVGTTLRITEGTQVSIAPLALYFPAVENPSSFPKPLVIPWLAGIVARAASAGIASITLAADVVERML